MNNPRPFAMKRISLLLITVFGMVYTGLAQTPVTPPGQSVHTPAPTSPADALQNKTSRSGTCQVVFDASGHVASAVITKSAGSKILDDNTLSYARKNWTGKPNTKVDVPIAYVMSPPQQPKGVPHFHTPFPPYPLQARARHYQGSGVAKVTFDEKGRASSVVMTQSTRSKMLDANTVAFALANWTSSGGKKKTILVPVTYRLR